MSFFCGFISAIAKESDAQTMSSNLSYPYPKICKENKNSSWYIFGYGSLFRSSSRIITQCNLQGQQADFIEWTFRNILWNTTFKKEQANCINEKLHQTLIPTNVLGYRRGW